MIARLSAGIVGVCAFLGMLMSGYLAENPFTTILIRALLGLGGGFLVGYLAGYIAQIAINDEFRKMAQTDVDTELQLLSQANSEEKHESENNSTRQDRQNKEDVENSRRQSGPLRDQSLSARAAQEALKAG